MTPDLPAPLVIDLHEIDRTQVRLVGGKGANLGELIRIEGVHVPAGFCVSTAAFACAVQDDASIALLLEQLAGISTGDHTACSVLGAEIRQVIEAIAIPEDVAAAVAAALQRLGDGAGYAVRSSATAEDQPTASFAGQHDSYLNITGAAVLDHVRRGWASLFSDRAISYRVQHGIDHRQVDMAVIVQQMVQSRAAGVLFTADPATSDRTVSHVEATFGLGDALVSGAVNADAYRIRHGVVHASIAAKTISIELAPGGGTRPTPIAPDLQEAPTLTDAQVLELVSLGRRIEAHLGAPQDIEWCHADGAFVLVQSRPITTLFPIPQANDDANHVYVSVGHQQMMTDPMKPLGLSFWQMTTPAPMSEAGSRLFVDVTAQLRSPATRAGLFDMLGRSDPLVRDALQTVLDRGDFVLADDDEAHSTPPPWGVPPQPIDTDPAIIDDLIETWQSSLQQLRLEIRSTTGPELFDLIARDIGVLRQLLFEPRSLQVIMAAIDATWWLNDQLHDWLGETNVADTLTQSAPGNVTSEMGLALLDVADVIRPHVAVVELLERVDAEDGTFLDALRNVDGGSDAAEAIEGFLDQYGMRCVGEIDITRPRWAERPTALVPVILGHVKNAQPGEAAQRFERGQREAEAKRAEILKRLRALPDGEAKAEETERMIHRVRTFIGYREYPKYAWISRYQEYRRALLAEAEALRRSGVIDDVEDVYFLSFDELRDAVAHATVDPTTIAARRAAFRLHETLTPPRVLTSDGEALSGRHHRDDLPPGALAGIAVSSGVVEGRARVIRDMAAADLGPGDILVTAHTDPSWSPLFVSISGLVTEVGGLMTHGAVVAREHGLPAVVGVERATERIVDGQRIRLDGTSGFVEILSS